MKLPSQQGGFTIVETLIALTTMSILFVVALASMLSYLKQNSFNTSLADLQQQLQSYITTSVNGQYNLNNYQCTLGSPPTFSSGGGSQGTTAGCIFVGTAVRFGNDLSGDGLSASTITAYPLAMDDCSVGSSDCSLSVFASSLTSSPVSTISSSSSNIVKSSYVFEGGLILKAINETTTTTTTKTFPSTTTTPTIVVFGFASPITAGDNSGSVNYSLYPFDSATDSTSSVYSYINGGTLSSSSLDQVQLCLQGATTQYGIITIGQGSAPGSLSVSTRIDSPGSSEVTTLC